MKIFMRQFEENVRNYPHEATLFDEANVKGLTFSELDELSGRVYAYLKKKQIGREDFCLICLPRGVMPVIAMLGVWKAGAAFVVVEDNYAPERIEYIRKDCDCKLVIDRAAMEEILATDYLKGYEETDDHDAAFVIYTSGTTGNPKGVVHEYGNILKMVASPQIDGEVMVNEKDTVGLIAPLNFVASIIIMVVTLFFRVRLHIISYASIKNPPLLMQAFLEKRITVTFLTPSYIRMLVGKTGPFLRLLIVSGEPAKGISLEGIDLFNLYAMSESGFFISLFKIDRPYETCPVGKPTLDMEIMLMDDEGKPVEEGEIGEICFETPYVRGYRGLPQETEKAFTGGIFHTGDMGKMLPDGNLVIVGRNNDMIKINGNRIEPAEIEAAFKELFDIEWAAAKGFVEGEHSYLCVYYTADIEIDAGKTREALLRKLPYYMIPSYYIKLPSAPLTKTGKLDRKALKPPFQQDYRAAYVAPSNETEEKLCDAFQKVLKTDRIGINDDFYELGGDSLKSLEVIVESKMPGLNTSMVFRGRTAKKIAKLYIESRISDDESDEVKNDRSMTRIHPLTAEQLYMFDYQLYTPISTMYNLFCMLQFDLQQIDMQHLATCVQMVIKNHPALLTTFSFNDDGEIVQRYTPEIMENITVEDISEVELDKLKDELVQPFRLINSKMYRCRVFRTEKNGYLFFDVHHLVFDGTSGHVFMSNISKAYRGMPMEKDYYYLMLAEREAMVADPFYEESKHYFEGRYGGVEWSLYPEVDHQSRENKLGVIESDLQAELTGLKKIEKKYGITRNEFFITVSALAIALYNQARDIRVSWIYVGRDDINMMNSAGLYFRDLPVGLRFEDERTVRNLYADVCEQVEKGIRHCCYPYAEKDMLVITDDVMAILYQQDIKDIKGLEGIDVEQIDIRQNKKASNSVLDVEIIDDADGIEFIFEYAASRYNEESIQRFKELYIKTAKVLIEEDAGRELTFKMIRDATH